MEEERHVEEHLGTALIEEATKKSSLVWVRVGDGRPQTLWHVWLDGAAHVVSGGAEQPFAGLAEALAGTAPVTVTVRSKDKGGRLVAYLVRPSRLEPGSEQWDAVAIALHGKRLNARDGEEQPARWARESAITRLEPTGDPLEAPGRMPTGAHATPPAESPATTLGALPYMLGRERAKTRAKNRARDKAKDSQRPAGSASNWFSSLTRPWRS